VTDNSDCPRSPQDIPQVPNNLIQRLYKFLRDDAVVNQLLDGKESSPGQLRMALEDSLDDWNTTPPPIPPVSFLTHPSRNLLIKGAVIEILISAGILMSRNRLSYNDGGISVQVSDKASDYSQWINMLVRNYESKKIEIKKTINVERGWGGVPSEYSVINQYRNY